MPIDWTPFVEIVDRHRRFLLTTHVRPDGDGLGSMIALAETLRRRGKEVELVTATTLPARYQFLNSGGQIKRFATGTSNWRKAEVIAVLDTGTWNQLGDFAQALRESAAAKVVIDHHQTQDDLGALRLVDASAEATGRLVYEAIRALKEPLSQSAAEALFVAIAMDTGWFRHSNTTAATLALEAELIAAGARPAPLYELLFEQNTLPRLKLTGLILDRLQTAANGRIAYTEVRRSDYEATGATPQDTEDLVNFPRSLSGVEVALFFMEQPPGGVKVSFRSRSRVDVARLAERFGGGGHRLASGATLEGSLEQARDRVLEALFGLLKDGF
jgi:phosphoesterase RecJ-like protein